jgi:hypothetical protein
MAILNARSLLAEGSLDVPEGEGEQYRLPAD